MASKAVKQKSKKSGEASDRKKPSKDINFKVGIYRVLKQVHPDQSIRVEALEELDKIALFVGKKIAKDAAILVGSESKTINGRAIMGATRALLPGELGKHAISDITKSITHTATANASEEHKGESRSHKAKLQMSVARAERVIREEACSYRVSETAGIALAAALEYLIAEIVELAGNAARDSKKVRISVKHIQLAVHNDSEMMALLGKGIFSGGGVKLVSMSYARSKPKKTAAASPKKKTSPKKKASPAKKKSPAKKRTVKKTRSLKKDEEGRSPFF